MATVAITNKFDGVLFEWSDGQEEYIPKNFYKPILVEGTKIDIEKLTDRTRTTFITRAADVSSITDNVRNLSISVPGTVSGIFDEIHTFFFRRSR